MSHGAQCFLCQHARRDGRAGKPRQHGIPIATGCGKFDKSPAPEVTLTEIDELQEVVAALLYAHAATHRCPAFQRMKLEPDAYFAEDAPR